MIVGSFNITASQNQFPDVILKYRCRILFTTCSQYENHIFHTVESIFTTIRKDDIA